MGNKQKIYRGTIENWQLHTLDFDINDVYNLYPQTYEYGLKKDDIKVITGNIYNDPSERWNDGDHYRSSIILKLNRDINRVITLNTILTLGKEGVTVCNVFTGEPDMGNDVLNLFY